MASLKERIVRGDIIVGVSVPITATKSQMEDILSKDDYAFIHADSQHSPYSEERLVQYCETAKEVGIPVQFRIKHPRHAYLVGNVLDLGPLGIEVPLVEDEATVDEAINTADFYMPNTDPATMQMIVRVPVGGFPQEVLDGTGYAYELLDAESARLGGEGLWVAVSRDPETGELRAASHNRNNSAAVAW